MAQLAEQLICNQQVIGSSPIIGLDINAGWSSLEARRAHNPKVAGSNPAPATYAKQSRLHARKHNAYKCPDSSVGRAED